MKLIAAVSKSWGIGKNNDLLYHISEDMKFFRSKTKDNVIIIGRKTLESFPGGKPLKNRVNIVLTRDKNFSKEDVVVANNTKELFKILENYKDVDVYVCGGEEIYKLLLPYCKTAYITKIDDDKESTKFIPDLDALDSWELTEESESFNDGEYSFMFCTYTNTSPQNPNTKF